MSVRFNKEAIPRSWFDYIDYLIDHGRHRSEDLARTGYWTGRISSLFPTVFVGHQVYFRLQAIGDAAKEDAYMGSDDTLDYYRKAGEIHEDIACELAQYADKIINGEEELCQ